MASKWDTAISDFRDYLRIERSLSPNTLSAYISDIRKLRTFMEGGPELGLSQRTITDPKDCSGEDLSLFLAHEVAQGLSKRSQARLVSSIKSFYGFLQLEGEIEERDPSELVAAPKSGRRIPVVLSVEEVVSILESVDLSEPEGHRNRAILEVLYSCGLRVSELTSLRISDLFFDEGFIRVIGKGDKQRLIPIGEPAMKAVRFYLSQTGRAMSQGPSGEAFMGTKPVLKQYEDILFLNRRGAMLSREMIFTIVKRQCEKAGISKTVSPHTFRHSFATHLVENGADLRVVQEMLGNESILTTEIYTHIDSNKWKTAILHFHPRH